MSLELALLYYFKPIVPSSKWAGPIDNYNERLKSDYRATRTFVTSRSLYDIGYKKSPADLLPSPALLHLVQRPSFWNIHLDGALPQNTKRNVVSSTNRSADNHPALLGQSTAPDKSLHSQAVHDTISDYNVTYVICEPTKNHIRLPRPLKGMKVSRTIRALFQFNLWLKLGPGHRTPLILFNRESQIF